MRRTVFVVFGITVFLLLVANIVGLTGLINHLLGERIVELKVKNSQGTNTSIYLKANADVLTISESPDMKYIALQENSAIQYDPIVLYKNTTDTLYIVWWYAGSGSPQIKTDANIHFIYESGINPELVQKYLSLGFTKFPKDAYN